MLDVIGMGERGAQGLAVLGEQAQPIAAVVEPLGDDMDDVLVALDAAMHHHQPRAHHHFALPLKHVGPDHRIGHAGFVLDGHEHHALRRARTLAHQNDAGHAHAHAVARSS